MRTNHTYFIAMFIWVWGAVTGCQTQPEIVQGEIGSYEATWESLYHHDATPQWYQDAVLGFYFHWGP